MSSGVEASVMAPDSTARDSSTSLGMTSRKAVVAALVEGNSLRAVTRMSTFRRGALSARI
jgi:hypothetical protein